MKKKILLVGPILTQSGYGEHTRLIYRALKSREDLFEIFINPIGWGHTNWEGEASEDRHEIDQLINKTFLHMQNQQTFDTTIMVTIPNEWEQYRAAPENIGVCAGIESDRVSPHWLDAANKFVDKIIVPSNFAKDVFLASSWDVKDQHDNPHTLKLQKPVEVVNYHAEDELLNPDESIMSDIKFDHDFNFLCVAQWGPRKNIHNTINSFVKEFKDDEVGLVLKVNFKNSSTMDYYETQREINRVLKNYPDRSCSVHLIHGYISKEEMASLLTHPQIKAMINFGHGEGFGLPLFESVLTGLPVITHEWGGQKDFLYAPKKDKKTKKEKLRPHFGKVAYELRPIQQEAVWDGVLQPESQWAYPNMQSCQIAMRQSYEHYSLTLGQAKKLKKWAVKKFNKEETLKQICNIIEDESWSHTVNDIQFL